MNFFSAQDRAKRYTKYLQLLFLCAITAIIAISNYFAYIWFYYQQHSQITFSFDRLSSVYDDNLTIILSSVIFGFIVIASFYRLMTLRSGGQAIAESIGGRIIPRSSDDPSHQKILNIVDEMAIASGIPVPPVYLLNEPGINAFAAGWKPSNSVIGVTKGAIEQLDRDELQGVIAHEFSHIFNGDMKLNLTLIAHLYGVLLIGETGRIMIRSMFTTRRVQYRTSSSSKKGQGLVAIIAIGATLFTIGYVGTLMGNWIKSLISRQREYLADASAVQYTRNNAGIANALKKIGGSVDGSYLLTARADSYSHGFFSDSAKPSMFSGFATHPPLEKRIIRLQPSWNGKFINAVQTPKFTHTKTEDKSQTKRDFVKGIAVAQALGSVNHIGDINHEQISIAKNWLANTPDFIRLYAKSSPDAQWLVLALLIDKKPAILKIQYAIIEKQYSAKPIKIIKWLVSNLENLEENYTSLIIELSLPALRQMSKNQYHEFHKTLKGLIKADKKIDLIEWCLQRVLVQQLDEYFGIQQKSKMSFYIIGSAKKPIETILSLLAYLEHGENPQALESFKLAVKAIGATAFKPIERKELNLKNLDHAVDQLQKLKLPLKKKFLKAAITCISHDDQVEQKSYEVLRSIATCMDTPLPPVFTKAA